MAEHVKHTPLPDKDMEAAYLAGRLAGQTELIAEMNSWVNLHIARLKVENDKQIAELAKR